MEQKQRRGRPKGGSSNPTAECIIKDPIMEPFYIKKDSKNFEVIQFLTSTRGFKGQQTAEKEVEKTIGYYTSFKNALECVARHKFYEKKEDYSSIKSYINSWQEVKSGIETLLNEIKI